MGERVEDYFQTRATAYQRDSERLPWSLLRRRERRAVLALAGSVEDCTAIDWGTGAGFYARALAEGGARRILAVDQSREMLAEIPSPIECFWGRAEEIELPEKGDVAVCAGLLEFVDDPSAVFCQFARYAKPSMRLTVLVPYRNLAGEWYRRFHRSHGISVRLFDAEGLRRLGEPAGFRFERQILVRPFSLCVGFRKEAAA